MKNVYVTIALESMNALSIRYRVVIFEHSFETTLVTTYFPSLFISQKQWKEKKEERE